MRRYERPHINEVWCGDSSVGPHLTDADGKKHRIYIIALIDDASRFITGIDVFYNDNFINLMSVMKSAVSKYGRPKVLNFDNGKSYKNKQMELLAARIGTTLSYCQPYTPTSKAKIERWFRTLKDQWMAGLDMRDFRSLDELRGSCMLMCKAITWHLILPCAACHHRIVSSLSQIISAVLRRIISTKTSFWRLNGVFRQTVSSSLTRSNMKWTAGSHASGSGSGKSTLYKQNQSLFWG